MSLSLPDALCLAALEANARSQKRPFTVTAAGLPMARVSYHWTRAVRAGLDFLAGLDTGGPAQIEASAVTEAPGWMSLTLKLRLAERTQRPTEFDVSAMDQATAAVHELNGQFELSVDYPAIVVTLCLPVAMATMPE